jgi:hypothetical protein
MRLFLVYDSNAIAAVQFSLYDQRTKEYTANIARYSCGGPQCNSSSSTTLSTQSQMSSSTASSTLFPGVRRAQSAIHIPVQAGPTT